ILQVAVVADRPARAVKEVVHDAAKPPADKGAEHIHRFCGIMQARPSYGRGLVGDHDLVESLISLPQRLPVAALIRAQGPDHDIGCGHPTTLETFAALLSRGGMNPQQLRYSIRRPPLEPALRRDRDVFSHIFTPLR